MSVILKNTCINCNGILKKQTIGSNVLHYCPQCGTITTVDQYDYNVSKYSYNKEKAVAVGAVDV